MKHTKNYIGFINDHSGSMAKLKTAALKDYNSNMEAIKKAATREVQDTVVSVTGIGLRVSDYFQPQIKRLITISNPHVLQPMETWEATGETPLYDGIGDMIEMFKALPDATNPNVSFLLLITTDGEESHSQKYNANNLKQAIKELQNTNRWSFVFRVPLDANLSQIKALGIPTDNIQQWETTDVGMEVSSKTTAQAVDNYFTARSKGVSSTTAFYADASKVNIAALEDISKKVSLYVVPTEQNGIEIRDFILKYRMEYLKGSAFYQLTKTESRVSHTKLILVREQSTGKIYSGKDARSMIGLPNDRNARLHPGDHKNYDIFIQSESVNRKLVGGTGVIYWKEIGTQFTEADLAYLKSKTTVTTPEVVQLPKVLATNKPTKSPIPVTPKVMYFSSRKAAREYAKLKGKPVKDLRPGNNPRWAV